MESEVIGDNDSNQPNVLNKSKPAKTKKPNKTKQIEIAATKQGNQQDKKSKMLAMTTATPPSVPAPCPTRKYWARAKKTSSVTFSVQLAVPEGYLVCLVGDTDELGKWDPSKARVLRRDKDNLWSREVSLHQGLKVHYRYFVCQPLFNDPTVDLYRSIDSLSQAQGISILRWESSLQSRSIDLGTSVDTARVEVKDQAEPLYQAVLPGIHRSSCRKTREPDETNWNESPESRSSLNVKGASSNQRWSSGWLHGVTEVRLRLRGPNPIHIWTLDAGAVEINVKCSTMDYSYLDAIQKRSHFYHGPGSPPGTDALHQIVNASNLPLTSLIPGNITSTSRPAFASTVLVFKLGADLTSEPTPEQLLPGYQKDYGIPYTSGGFLSFKTQTFKLEALGFRFDYYVEYNGEFKSIGFSHLLPLVKTSGIKKLPIFSNRAVPIGELTVDCLVITPPLIPMDMEISYQSHWRYDDGWGIDAGHRGFGSTFNLNCENNDESFVMVKENTIASMKTAHDHGVKFVEFDVLLCKDMIPVVFHDFLVNLSYYQRHYTEHDLYEVGVHNLSLAQLQSCKLYHVSEVSKTIHEDDMSPMEWEPFPTLEHTLQKVDPALGYIIEIKYPQKLASGVNEVNDATYIDRNTVLDIILKEVFEHAGSRQIVFSSFDADMCILLELKQNRYPVTFLSQGQSNAFPAFEDCRATSFSAALQFAVSETLLGVVLNSHELIKDLTILRRAENLGLVVFVWGEENNNPAIKEFLKSHKVAVIISDRVKQAPIEVFEMPADVQRLPLSTILQNPQPFQQRILSTSPLHSERSWQD